MWLSIMEEDKGYMDAKWLTAYRFVSMKPVPDRPYIVNGRRMKMGACIECPHYADIHMKNEPINRGAADRFEGSINN